MVAPVAVAGVAAGANLFKELSGDTDEHRGALVELLASPTNMMTAAAVLGMPEPQRRKLIRQGAKLAKSLDLDARTKVAWDALDVIHKAMPDEMAGRTARLLHNLQTLKGEQLRYGPVTQAKNAFLEKYKNFPVAWANAINAHREGLKMDLANLPDAQGNTVRDLVEAAKEIEATIEGLNRQINDEYARLGAKDRQILPTAFGLHPRVHPQTGGEIGGFARNMRDNVIFNRQTGLTEGNRASMEKAIEGYILGNAYHDGEKVVWRKMSDRDALKHPVNIEGRDVTPDQIRSKEEFSAWAKAQAKRTAGALIESESGLKDSEIDGEFKTKIPYLGPDVHRVTMEDFARELDGKLRDLEGLKRLPDNAIADRIQLEKDIEGTYQNISDVGKAGHGLNAERDALQSVMTKEGGIFEDFDKLTGRPPKKTPSNWLSSRLNALHNTMVSPTMQVLLEMRPTAAALQTIQVAMMSAAQSNDWLPLKAVSDQFRTSKMAKLVDKVIAQFVADGGISIETIPSSDRMGWLQNKVEQALPLRISNEAAEAATVHRSLQDLKQWFLNPADPRQKYASRTWSPTNRQRIAQAIGSGDDKALLDLVKPYVIERLDQVNGSGAATSRFNFMTGNVATPLWTLAATPFRTTVKNVMSRASGATGDMGSRSNNIAMGARSAALIGAQAATNAAVRGFPALKGAALVAGGMPLYGAFTILRRQMQGDDDNQAKMNQGNFSTMMSAAGRIPGSLASGDFKFAANDIAGLAGVGLSESMAGKFIESGDALDLLRSKYDYQLGSPKAYQAPTYERIAGLFPSLTALPVMAYGMADQAINDPMNLFTQRSRFSLAREVSPISGSLANTYADDAMAKAKKALEDAKKGVTTTPNTVMMVDKKKKKKK